MAIRRLQKEANEFFSSTSIHGFPYISNTQSGSTRVIWTVIVLASFGINAYFLFETLNGFNEKYVTTTLETKSIKDYPFPAVTFHPGEYNSKNAFLRHFLNQFEFTRYDEDSPLRNNELFLNSYQWLVSSINDELFDDAENYLFYTSRGQSFLAINGHNIEEETCKLLSLYYKDISLKSEIRNMFMSNMYKFRYYQIPYSFIHQEIGPIIEEAVDNQNITKSDIFENCKYSAIIQEKLKAMLLSFIYIFSDAKDVGAGDMATGPYSPTIPAKTHTELTHIFNDMVNGSLPVSILNIPQFFVLPDKNFAWKYGWGHKSIIYMDKEFYEATKKIFLLNEDENVKSSSGFVKFTGITEEAMRNYHYLWYSHIHNTSITLICMNNMGTDWWSSRCPVNCSQEPLKFFSAEAEWHYSIIESIRNDSIIGDFLEIEAVIPPCKSPEIVKKFKIGPICSLLDDISNNKLVFLKLMKFTKQSPVYLEDREEYSKVASKYDFTLKNDTKVKYLNMF